MIRKDYLQQIQVHHVMIVHNVDVQRAELKMIHGIINRIQLPGLFIMIMQPVIYVPAKRMIWVIYILIVSFPIMPDLAKNVLQHHRKYIHVMNNKNLPLHVGDFYLYG